MEISEKEINRETQTNPLEQVLQFDSQFVSDSISCKFANASVDNAKGGNEWPLVSEPCCNSSRITSDMGCVEA